MPSEREPKKPSFSFSEAAALLPEVRRLTEEAHQQVEAMRGRAERGEDAAALRKLIRVSHGDAVAAATRILYGGSVKPDNAAALFQKHDIDGALVGGACLQADTFLKIVRAAG